MICYLLENQIIGKKSGKERLLPPFNTDELRKVANELNFF